MVTLTFHQFVKARQTFLQAKLATLADIPSVICCISSDESFYANLVKRQAEVELLPMAQSEKLGVTPYSPLGGGLLTGKYGPDMRPESGRLVDNKMYKTRYSYDWMYTAARCFTDFAAKYNYRPASLAVAWVAAHPAVTAPIIGARNLEQLKSSIGSLDIDMNSELREEISALSPAPQPATDRNEENSKDNYGSR